MTEAETSAPGDEAQVAAIDLDALRKSYHEKVAVDRLRFAVSRGFVTGLLGGNGAGTSTTIGMTMGLILPTSGYRQGA